MVFEIEWFSINTLMIKKKLRSDVIKVCHLCWLGVGSSSDHRQLVFVTDKKFTCINTLKTLVGKMSVRTPPKVVECQVQMLYFNTLNTLFILAGS